jgi:hypothetical protein
MPSPERVHIRLAKVSLQVDEAPAQSIVQRSQRIAIERVGPSARLIEDLTEAVIVFPDRLNRSSALSTS